MREHGSNELAVLKARKNCKWCQAVKADPKLLKRIYKSSYYTKDSRKESLRAIAADVGLPYHSLPNHCKYHQGLTDDELNSNKVEQIAKKTANQLIETNVATTAARQGVIDSLAAASKDIDLNVMAQKDPAKLLDLLLKATKHADDVKAKSKDQELDVFKYMNALRSGSIKPQADGKVIEGEWEEFTPPELAA